jgi:hypothetical protein
MVQTIHCPHISHRANILLKTIRMQRMLDEESEMRIPKLLTWRSGDVHNTKREGVRLGVVIGTATWLWVSLVDGLAGQPFHTLDALGGALVFTVLHYSLNIVYGLVVLSAVHGAEHAPSLIIALMFGVVTLEGAFAMLTNVVASASVGNIAWIGVFGGSLIGTAIAIFLLSQAHPLAEYLHQAEAET